MNVCRLASRALGAGILLAVVSVTLTGEVHAQFPPDTVTNLQVLPPDMTPRQVIGVMRSFSQSLGVRCEYCHVGEAGLPLSTFDFATDDKSTKLTARVMLQMVQAINGEHLTEVAQRQEPNLEVTCLTCHRGLARPVQLADVLAEVVDAEGADAAVAEYRELREQYYGSGSYDFGEGSLGNLATRYAQADEFDAAITLQELNLEFFSESGTAHFTMGDVFRAKGDTALAIQHYERAGELDEGIAQRIQRLLRALTGNE